MSDFSDMADRISKFRKSWKEGVSETTVQAVERMEREVAIQLRTMNNSVARGNLLRSIASERQPTTGDVLVAVSVTAPSWGKYVEYGTGLRGRRDTQPNHEQYKSASPKPPIDPILTWVLAKNIVPREYDSQESLAYAIQETLGELGQIPRPFMRPVWFSQRHGYKSVVTDNHLELKKQLRRL